MGRAPARPPGRRALRITEPMFGPTSTNCNQTITGPRSPRSRSIKVAGQAKISDLTFFLNQAPELKSCGGDGPFDRSARKAVRWCAIGCYNSRRRPWTMPAKAHSLSVNSDLNIDTHYFTLSIRKHPKQAVGCCGQIKAAGATSGLI